MEKLEKSSIKRFAGTHWWGDSSKAKEDKVITAHFKNEERKVDIDYEFRGKQEWLKLDSNNGIHFIGKFGRIKEVGTCEFTLYKNKEGWLLFGGGFSPEEGDFKWYIKLNPFKSET